ncbi:MAG: HEAT repeat domain-containing protein [Spirulina sp. SIO3F2]|nr:HEAT repeat domain-containing protein [Spirulina sp. SIO3F2]
MKKIFISGFLSIALLISDYVPSPSKAEGEFSTNSDKPVNVQELLQEFGRYGYFPESGLESGRTIMCYEESGYSYGGDSDLASLSLKAIIPDLVAILETSSDPETLIRAARVLSLINSKAVPTMATPVLEKLLIYKNLSTLEIHRNLPDYDIDDPLEQYPLEQQVHIAVSKALRCIMANTQDPQRRGFKVHESKERLSIPTETEIINKISELTAYWSGVDSSYCPTVDLNKSVNFVEEFGLGRLSRIGYQGQATVNPLLEYIGSDAPSLRIAVIRALGKTNAANSNTIAIIAKYLEDECISVHNETIITLGKLGNRTKSVAVLLIGGLSNTEDIIRLNTAKSLGSIGATTPIVVELLLRTLKQDQNSSVRMEAAIALLKLKSEDTKIVDVATKEVLELLEENDPDIRLALVRGLVEVDRIPQSLLNKIFEYFANAQESMEVRLNSLLILGKLTYEKKSTLELDIKSFLLEALTRKPASRYFQSSNVIGFSNSLWIGDDRHNEEVDEETLRQRERLYSFYNSWPTDKLHAFFLSTAKVKKFPELNEALRGILEMGDNEFKSRYNSAFILGFIEDPTNPSPQTIKALESIMNNVNEDFDIRWISAFSLVRLGVDTGNFFGSHNLPNPVYVDCELDKFGEGNLVFDPYFGWCEPIAGGGGSFRGWSEAIECFFKRRC